MPVDECRIRVSAGTVLYAYELPSPLPSSTVKASHAPSIKGALTPTYTAAARAKHSSANIPNGTGPCSVADFIKSSRGQDSELTRVTGQELLLQQQQGGDGGQDSKDIFNIII